MADVRPFLYRCGPAMAVPLRIAGGSRLKILEALACGLPVVASTCRAEGLTSASGRPFRPCRHKTAEMARVLIELDRVTAAGAGAAWRRPASRRSTVEEARLRLAALLAKKWGLGRDGC